MLQKLSKNKRREKTIKTSKCHKSYVEQYFFLYNNFPPHGYFFHMDIRPLITHLDKLRGQQHVLSKSFYSPSTINQTSPANFSNCPTKLSIQFKCSNYPPNFFYYTQSHHKPGCKFVQSVKVISCYSLISFSLLKWQEIIPSSRADYFFNNRITAKFILE